MSYPYNSIDQLAARAAATQASAAARRDAAAAAIRQIIDRAQAQGRTQLTAAEAADVTQLRAQRAAARTEMAGTFGIEDLAAEEAAYAARSRQVLPGAGFRDAARQLPAYDDVMRIGAEARTYRPDTDPKGRGFLLDVARNYLSADPGASARLQQHAREERVERAQWYALHQERTAGDSTTANWAGLTVPQYLVDAAAPQISALRPFADAATRKTPLPAEGMEIRFSKVTTGSSVVLQSAELAAPSGVSVDDTLGTGLVQTATGWQNVSRQAIERGTGIEDATMNDLQRKWAVTLDATLITQAATGLQNVAQAVTYTSASPTAAEMWPYLMQASSKLEQALQGVAYPTHLILHSRRFNWLCSLVGTSVPFIGNQAVPPQMGGVTLTNEYGSAVRAVLSNGLKVVVDNNVPTTTGGTQDEIYVVAADESVWLAEDANAPLFIRAEQPNAASLGILIVVYSYFAYFSRYANPASVVKGTGTAAPAGF